MPGTYQVFKEEKQQMISKVQEWSEEVDIAQVTPISWCMFQCLLTWPGSPDDDGGNENQTHVEGGSARLSLRKVYCSNQTLFVVCVVF